MWGGEECGIQGVIELSQVERCKDGWFGEVQQQVRHGCLSEDNWNFLHGRPTTVPGSWANNRAQCGQTRCSALASTPPVDSRVSKKTRATSYTNDEILRSECDVCKAERASKARVATDANDPRFSSEKFSKAIAIFAHNDVKYDTNKTRAKLFASRQSEGIVYAVAKDTPSQDALRERPGLQAQKIKWLQRHDRECGDLYGCLPLIHGMPVATADHIDRSPDKTILRGRIGYVHSWVLH